MVVRQPHHIHNLLTKPINGKSSRRSGFTLVELSIVLVIIGLLISGILVGKSLIKNVQLKKLQRNIVQMEVITRQFYQKYKQLPGDSNRFQVRGNGNERVEHGERRDALVHLALAGMLPIKYKDIDVGQSGFVYDSPFQVGVNTIDVGIDNVGLSFSNSDWSGIAPSNCVDGNDRKRANFFALSDLTGNITDTRSHTSHYAPKAFINRFDYLALDKKMDDGNGRNGKLWAYGDGGEAGSNYYCTRGYNTCIPTSTDWVNTGFWNPNNYDGSIKGCGILYWYEYK